MNRGAARQPIYLHDDDCDVFLEVIKDSAKLFGIRIIAFSLMPNHYHLLLQTPKGNLSRAMRHLNGVYTQRFNRLHKKDGPLFRGRFKAILVQEDEYLTHLIRYIHLNPVTAGLVSDLSKCSWTSHRQYLRGDNEGSWLYVRLGLAFFSDKAEQALNDYRRFMKEGVDLRTLSFYNKKHLNPILGDEDFLKKIKDKYILTGQKLDTEIPDERKLAGSAMAHKVIREVSKRFSRPRQEVMTSKRGVHNPAYFAAISLTRELSGLRLTEIAQIFQSNSYRTIATGYYRFNKKLQKDAKLKKHIEEIRITCSQEKT